MPAAETLTRVLARRQLLLVLDNCEHVIGAAAQLCAGLLQACDDVRVLATSREPLAVAGEARYRLAPLPVPGPDDDSAGAEAVTLFADRARAVDVEFALTGQNRADVGRLVGRLDGMPLAIELAAARVEALGVPQLAGLLDGRLGLLAGGDRLAAGRHRSLAAAAQWSYQLLDDQEQRVFRLLSVFPAPFTLEAAGAVAGQEAAPAVLRLVDCSLLVPPRTGPDGRSRYGMLETLRSYGAGLLAEAGEQDQAQAALARYALQVAEQAAAGLTTSTGEPAAAQWLDAEDAATAHVLGWAVAHDLDVAVRLVVALGWWWLLRAGWPASSRCCASWPGALSRAVTSGARRSSGWPGRSCTRPTRPGRCSGAPRSWTYSGTGSRPGCWWTAWSCSRSCCPTLGGSRRRPHRAAAPWPWPASWATRSARSVPRMSWSSPPGTPATWTAPCSWPGRPGRCRTSLAKIARELGHLLAGVLADAGDLPAAGQACAAALAQARDASDLNSLGYLLPLMADLDLQADRAADAGARLREAAQLALQTGLSLTLLNVLYYCVYLCSATGRPADAITAWAVNQSFDQQDGAVGTDAETRRLKDALRQARQAIGPDRARAAEQRGAAMSLATAAEYALMLTAPGPPPAPAAPGAARLSARERELVTLVAQGRTDADIAGQLYISIRTVRSHLDRIRDKTGCRRRADLTRLALSRRPGLARPRACG